MGLSAFPRFHYRGILQANVATANNGRVILDGSNPLCDPVSVTLRPNNLPPNEVKDWLRSRPNAQAEPNASWNYSGDMGIWFDRTTITSIQTSPQGLSKGPSSDPLVGATLALRGNKVGDHRAQAVMVDVNPFGGFTTQVISGSLELSIGRHVVLEAEMPSRAHSYFVNFWRNLVLSRDRGASAVFQITFPKEHIKISHQPPIKSPGLDRLKDELEKASGLVTRFCLFMMGTGAPPSQVNPDISNPRPLLLLGTIAPAQDGESDWYPDGRVLHPLKEKFTIPDDICSFRPNRKYSPGPAIGFVHYAERRLTLDLINAIPEREAWNLSEGDRKHLPEKVDLGPLTVGVTDSKGNTQKIAELPYAKYSASAYLETGGLIDLEYSRSLERALREGTLIIECPTIAPNTLLSECPFNIIPDRRALSLAADSRYNNERTSTVSFRVRHRGAPLSQPLSIEVIESPLLGKGDSRLQMVTKAQEEYKYAPRQEGGTKEPLPKILKHPSSLEMSGTDRASFTIEAIQPGLTRLFITVKNSGCAPDEMAGFFVNIRVFPEDNFESITDDDLRSKFGHVYDNILVYYDVLFPVMSRIVDLSNEQDLITAAPLIALRAAESTESSTLYMPVTRDLSPGKRRLLLRWTALQSS